MPPEAKVFIAEDRAKWQATYERILPIGGHSVVATATTMDEASEVIPTLGDLGVQVAIVDGNLGEDTNGEDGRLIADQLRNLYPDIKIVGASMDPDGVHGADVNVWKGRMEPRKLVDLITEL